MDAARREKLEEKRRLLHLRIRRRELSKDFRSIAPELCARGVKFSKLMPAACKRALGDLASGPGQDERLDWSWVSNATSDPWDDDDERDALLRAALRACCEADTAVAVVISPFGVGLRLSAADLAANAALVWRISWGRFWIVAAGGGRWLIEVGTASGSMEAAVSFSRAMPPPYAIPHGFLPLAEDSTRH